jgi:hypothetical protein
MPLGPDISSVGSIKKLAYKNKKKLTIMFSNINIIKQMFKNKKNE